MTALYAIPVIAAAAYIGYRWGQHKAFRYSGQVIALLAQGELKLTEDGIRTADAPHVEEQREAATWQ